MGRIKARQEATKARAKCQDTIQKALNTIRAGTMSIREAEVAFMICYGLTERKVEGAGTEYIRKVNHVLRTIVIALISQYPRRQPSLYDSASRPWTLRSYSPSVGI